MTRTKKLISTKTETIPFKYAVVAAIFSCLIGTQIKAQDRSAIYMLQGTLNQHGFVVGKPDGLIGPKTNNAIADFANKYKLPSEPNALLSALVSRSMSHSLAITREANISDTELEKIKLEVGALLKDPGSVQIRELRIAESPEGRFYCGEVNGKNAYGGYAGFVDFNSLPGFLSYPTFYIEKPNDDFIFWQCALAIPKKD